MHSRRMFEGYSVTLPPSSETKGNPEPRELLDDDISTEPCSEVRRASSPSPEPDATGKGHTLGFEPAEGEITRVTPVEFQAMADAARSMHAHEDRKNTPGVRRPTALGLGAAGSQSSKPPEFYAAETGPLEPVEPAAEKPTLAPAPRTPNTTSALPATKLSDGTRAVNVIVRLSETLLKGRAAYVTVTLPTGEVLFEGDAVADDDGGARADVHAVVPSTVGQVKALVEAGGTYRTAMVSVGDDGPTEYTFA